MNDRHDESEFPRARARGKRTDDQSAGPLVRMRVILERFGEPGGWTKDAEAELAARFDVTPHTIEVDACNVSNFIALAGEIGGMKPFLTANLTAMLIDARMRGKAGEGAKVAEVLGKVTGDIAPAGAVNILIDAKTGGLKPEVARAMQDAQAALLEAARRAATACGVETAAFDAALAAEMGAPAMLGGGEG